MSHGDVTEARLGETPKQDGIPRSIRLLDFYPNTQGFVNHKYTNMKRRFLYDTGAPTATSGGAPIALNLSKGNNINLTKGAGHVTKVGFGMSWDAGGAACDPDASAFCLGADGKLHGATPDDSIIFYGHLSAHGVTHSGDNRTGDANGDDEVITVDLTTLDQNVDKVVFVATIYDEKAIEEKRPSTLNFGQTKNLKIRVFDAGNPDEKTNTITTFDLTEDYSANNTLVFGELYRKDGDLKFRAIGDGGTGDLNILSAKYR